MPAEYVNKRKVAEVRSERVITFEEEDRLLAACDNNLRRPLRPILIAAVDTGMRMGELLKLKWRNVDLAANGKICQALNKVIHLT